MSGGPIDPDEIRKMCQQGEDQTVKFADYLHKAINENYLLIGLTSSHTQGRIKSLNLPFGVGKTTFTMWTSYITQATPGTYPPTSLLKTDPMKFWRIYNDHNPYDLSKPDVIENWNHVFRTMVYNIVDVAHLVMPGAGPRKDFGIWDDTPATAPAERGVPAAVYKLKGYITTARPEIACLMMTAANRNEICAPLRKLVVLEVIVAERGVYEVQRVKFYKTFRNPDLDMARLDYLEEGLFPPLPTPVQERYDAWRVQEKKKLFPNIEEDLQRWLKMYNPLGGDQLDELDVRVIKEGSNYRITLPSKLGEKYYRKSIKIKIPSQKEEEPLEFEQPAEEESSAPA